MAGTKSGSSKRKRDARMRALWRRIERAILGAGMSVAALVIERRVLKAIKAKDRPAGEREGPG